MGRSEKSKAIALVRLHDFFQAGGVASAAEISEKYGRSHRAVNDWLRDIDRFLVPLRQDVTGPTKGKWRKL